MGRDLYFAQGNRTITGIPAKAGIQGRGACYLSTRTVMTSIP